MEYAPLGRSDLKVSKIGLGAWQFGDVDWGWGTSLTEQQAVQIIRRAVELGVNFFDTAEVYGDGVSEIIVGSALREYGDSVAIATKVSGQHLRYKDVLKAAEGSLRRLQRKTIDLYQVHWPSYYVPINETMKAMKKLVKEGKVRYAGVSNFSLPLLKETNRHLRTASNQVRYNLLQRDIEKDLMGYARARGVAIIAFSPLAQGFLTGKFSAQTRPTDGIRKEHPLTKQDNITRIIPALRALESVATSRSVTMSQVALAWLTRKRIVFAIPGAKSIAQLEENVGAADVQLSSSENQRIDAASASVEIDYF
jgi:aryl-alcohol dehydrogenase-like predicted oxidoreductase